MSRVEPQPTLVATSTAGRAGRRMGLFVAVVTVPRQRYNEASEWRERCYGALRRELKWREGSEGCGSENRYQKAPGDESGG